jgi:hypothetical protein
LQGREEDREREKESKRDGEDRRNLDSGARGGLPAPSRVSRPRPGPPVS